MVQARLGGGAVSLNESPRADSKRAPPRGGIGLLAALVGCSVQVGAAGGLRTGDPARGVWGAPVSVNFHVPTVPAVVGIEAEGAGDARYGSQWTTGIHAGWSPVPPSLGTRVRAEVVADLGAPLAEGGFGPGWYAGVTAALALWFWPRHSEAERNRGTWFVRTVPQLVVFVRSRAVDDHRSGGEDVEWELTFGFAGRIRIVSDLLP